MSWIRTSSWCHLMCVRFPPILLSLSIHLSGFRVFILYWFICSSILSVVVIQTSVSLSVLMMSISMSISSDVCVERVWVMFRNGIRMLARNVDDERMRRIEMMRWMWLVMGVNVMKGLLEVSLYGRHLLFYTKFHRGCWGMHYANIGMRRILMVEECFLSDFIKRILSLHNRFLKNLFFGNKRDTGNQMII